MKFEKAFELMKQGKKMKLPSWGGFWTWDKDKQTIMMYCRAKDSETGKDVLDIRETQRVEYTLLNILSDEWEEATGDNCTLLGGTPTFGFKKACEYINRGIPVKRKCKNGDSVWLGNPSIKDFTIADIMATDWTFAD